MCHWSFKYVSVVPVKDKNGITIVNVFQSILVKKKTKKYMDWSRP